MMFSGFSPVRGPRRLWSVVALCGALAACALTLTTAASAARGGDRARAAATPSCATSGLVIWMDTQGNGTAGTIFYTLEFTNLSGRTCTLRGYPGVSAINLSGGRVGSAASRLTGHAVKTVTLGKGATATATLGAVDTGALPNCRMTTAAGLRVYPPNQTASRTIPFPFPACANSGPAFLRVAPVAK
ncbi:MAG TPA: DUF4232 domain-containing protein [Solirubrobacteraceae bacterium]|nr:DUF4232 domain-containing protein [Solirubrobacteraceae bacterium]